MNFGAWAFKGGVLMGGAIGSFVPLTKSRTATAAKFIVIIGNGVALSMVKMQ